MEGPITISTAHWIEIEPRSALTDPTVRAGDVDTAAEAAGDIAAVLPDNRARVAKPNTDAAPLICCAGLVE